MTPETAKVFNRDQVRDSLNSLKRVAEGLRRRANENDAFNDVATDAETAYEKAYKEAESEGYTLVENDYGNLVVTAP